jgi:hypothetical protein
LSNLSFDEASKHFHKVRSSEPFDMAPLRIMPAQEAYEWVIEYSGATIPCRDAVDERIVKTDSYGHRRCGGWFGR